MASDTMLKFILELLAVLLISYGFYKEENIIKLEQKIYRKIKRTIKRCKQ